jgi:Protein of unknown function (DUF2034)
MHLTPRVHHSSHRLLSTVQRGTAFEYRALALLTKHLSMSLTRVGGSYDGGIDLIGWWWVPSATNPATCAYRVMFLSPPPLKSYPVASRPTLQLLSITTPPPLQSHPAWATGTQPTGAACASSPNAKPKRERWAPRTYASSRASCISTPAPPAPCQRPTGLFLANALPKTSALAATRNCIPRPPRRQRRRQRRIHPSSRSSPPNPPLRATASSPPTRRPSRSSSSICPRAAPAVAATAQVQALAPSLATQHWYLRVACSGASSKFVGSAGSAALSPPFRRRAWWTAVGAPDYGGRDNRCQVGRLTPRPMAPCSTDDDSRMLAPDVLKTYCTTTISFHPFRLLFSYVYLFRSSCI